MIAHGGSPDFFADLLAVWEAGGTAVCINPGLTPDELRNVVSFVDARLVLVADDSADAGLDEVPVICTTRDSAGSAGDPAMSARVTDQSAARVDDPALVLFTSGTTGEPKGVVHSFRSLLARVALNRAWVGADALARSLCVLPTHFGHELIGNCLTPLLGGDELFLLPGGGVAGARALGGIVERHRIGFMSLVPAFWRLALRLSDRPPDGLLRRVHIGSAPLSSELWREVMAWSDTDAVANMYGITETTNWIGGALASDLAPEDGLVGRPWGGSVALLGANGRPAGHGEGEVLVQTPSLMQGYLRRPDLTGEVQRDGWYHTGDIGSLDGDGVLRLTGRSKYAINRAGIKVYPEELDLLLERHPAVVEACAFASPDAVSGEAVGAAVHLHEGADLTPAGLVDWLRGRIRAEAIPARIFPVAEIPKTDRGKLNRERVAAFCLGSGQPGATLDGGRMSVGACDWEPGALLRLDTERFSFRSMTRESVTDAFIVWLADPEVMLGLNMPRRRLSLVQAVHWVLGHDNRSTFRGLLAGSPHA